MDALKKLVEKKAKAKGKKIIEEPDAPAPRGSNVIDLMAALKNSVGGKAANDEDDDKPAKKATTKKGTAKKPAPKKEAPKARKRA